MKHVKNFESYNEEVNWKALATGAALGASALIGCGPKEQHPSGTQNYIKQGVSDRKPWEKSDREAPVKQKQETPTKQRDTTYIQPKLMDKFEKKGLQRDYKEARKIAEQSSRVTSLIHNPVQVYKAGDYKKGDGVYVLIQSGSGDKFHKDMQVYWYVSKNGKPVVNKSINIYNLIEYDKTIDEVVKDLNDFYFANK